MNIEISDIKPGDIILCRPMVLEGDLKKIADEMKIPYVHTCICCSKDEVAHASLSKIERRKVTVLIRGNRNLAVFRSLAPWSTEQIAQMNQFVDGSIERGVQFSKEKIYDYLEARPAHDNKVVEAFFSQEQLPECSFNSDIVFCSEFVAQCCAMSGRFSDKVTNLFRPDVQSPKDVISDSAFACQFVGFLAEDEERIQADDPFSDMQTWSEFVASLRTTSEQATPDDEAIQDFLEFHRQDAEAFNAFVNSDSLLIRFRKATTENKAQADS